MSDCGRLANHQWGGGRSHPERTICSLCCKSCDIGIGRWSSRRWKLSLAEANRKALVTNIFSQMNISLVKELLRLNFKLQVPSNYY